MFLGKNQVTTAILIEKDTITALISNTIGCQQPAVVEYDILSMYT